ncbi:MAG: hypothetical protein E7Y34_02530 [Mycoplasma sp.]|nr:hypothetical protein [Mycoplasma sp.]
MSRQSLATQIPASKQIYKLLNHFEDIVNHYAFAGGFEISGKITKPHNQFKGLIELENQIKFDIETTDKGDKLVQKIIDSVASFAKFPAKKSYTLLVGSNVAKVLTTYANDNNTASTMKTLREKLEEAFSITFSHNLITKDEIEKFKDYLVLFPNDNTLIKFVCGFGPSLFPRVHTHSALSGEQMVCLMSNAGFLAKDNVMLISKLKTA